MSQEFFEYKFRCEVVRAQAGHASCLLKRFRFADSIDIKLTARSVKSAQGVMDPKLDQNSIAVSKIGRRRRAEATTDNLGLCQAGDAALKAWR